MTATDLALILAMIGLFLLGDIAAELRKIRKALAARNEQQDKEK